MSKLITPLLLVALLLVAFSFIAAFVEIRLVERMGPLPEGVKIEKSNKGNYRWVDNGYASFFSHSTETGAKAAYWRYREKEAEKWPSEAHQNP